MQASRLLLRSFWRPRTLSGAPQICKTLSSVSACPLPPSVTPTNAVASHPWFAGPLCSTRSFASNAELLDQVNTEIEGENDQSNLFCVVHISGRQFKVTANDLIVVNRIQAQVGAEIFLEKVLLAGSDNFTLVGTPLLSEEVARVRATVVEHNKMAKVVVFKKKRRKNYKRTKGHRQPISVLRINSILVNPVQ